MTGILFFLKRMLWFVKDHWRVVVPIIVLIIALVFFVRWWNRPAKINEKDIQKAKTAIAEQDREVMVEVLVQSDLDEKQIDANTSTAENVKLKTLDESRKKIDAMTTDEMAQELQRRLNP